MTPHTRRTNIPGRVAAAPLLVAVALSTLPVPSRAADDQPATTYICRPADTGEISNARMTANTDTPLTCRPISVTLKMSNGSLRTIGHVSAQAPSGPDLGKALTPAQINDAWVRFIDETFHIQHTS